MATYQPPKKNTAYIFYASLVSQANTKINQASPTIAAGDFKVSTDGAALGNLTTLPTNTPAGADAVKFSLSAAEMNGDNIFVQCIDAAGAEWCSASFLIQTSAQQIDDLATQASVNTIDDFIDTEVAAIVTAIAAVQADLPQRITKGVALAAFPFFMASSTDHVSGAIGLTVTATRSIDGAVFGACANAVVEIANGWYKIDLAAADLNGNTIALKFTATGADQQGATIVTEPT